MQLTDRCARPHRNPATSTPGARAACDVNMRPFGRDCAMMFSQWTQHASAPGRFPGGGREPFAFTPRGIRRRRGREDHELEPRLRKAGGLWCGGHPSLQPRPDHRLRRPGHRDLDRRARQRGFDGRTDLRGRAPGAGAGARRPRSRSIPTSPAATASSSCRVPAWRRPVTH